MTIIMILLKYYYIVNFSFVKKISVVSPIDESAMPF